MSSADNQARAAAPSDGSETRCERFRYAGVHPNGVSRLCECGLKYDEHRPEAQTAESSASRASVAAPTAASGCQCETCRAHVFNPSRLMAARHRRGLTRWHLAVALDLPSVVPLGRIERGEKDPGESLIEKMAEKLNFPVGFFYAHDLPEFPTEACS